MKILNGTRLLANIGLIPECQRQVTMAFSSESESRFYEQVTGEPFEREFGMRQSARRRGMQFENNLFQNDAIKLQAALAPVLDIEPGTLYVRNLDLEELPPSRTTKKTQVTPGIHEGRVLRHARTRSIIADSLDPTRRTKSPDLVIHPQLLIPVDGMKKPWLWVEPDFMVWVPKINRYVPGDLKSFVVEDRRIDPGDLVQARLQIAAQIHALEHCYQMMGETFQHRNGLLVFSTPYGLQPAPVREFERLDGPYDVISKAREALSRHAVKISQALGDLESPRLNQVAFEAPNHYCENCIGSCIFAPYCAKDHHGTAQQLGDEAASILGSETSLGELLELLQGSVSPTESQKGLVEELRRTFLELGLRWSA